MNSTDTERLDAEWEKQLEAEWKQHLDWINVRRVCWRCTRDVTDEEFFSGRHVRGTCPINRAPASVRNHYEKKRREKSMAIAAEKFEAYVADNAVLVIPKKSKEMIEKGFAERIRADLQTVTDAEIVEEARLRLERYVRDKAQRDEVRAARIWCEVRLGELLGLTTKGQRSDLQPTPASVSVSEDDRYKFRLLANNQEIVEQCIKAGITSRAAIIAAIKAANGNGNGKKTLDLEAESE